MEFILEPLYKLFSQVVGENEAELKETLNGLGIYLKASDYGMDVKPLLKIVLARFFGDIHGFVDMLVKHVPSPNNAAKTKVGFFIFYFPFLVLKQLPFFLHQIPNIYTGPLNSTFARSMLACDPNGPLVIHIVKVNSSHFE